jgi:hypothetical protein
VLNLTTAEQGGKDEFALHLWVPPRQKGLCDEECWGGGLDLKEMRRQLGECEPRYNQFSDVGLFWLIKNRRLLKLTKLAATPARVQVKMVPPIEDWVDEHGRMVIIGEAAHPLPVCYNSDPGITYVLTIPLGRILAGRRNGRRRRRCTCKAFFPSAR